METRNIYRKNPADGFDITIDWSDFLATAATVTSCTWTLPAGLTKDPARTTNGSKTSTLWVTGGTAGTYYEVKGHMVASDGTEKDRSFMVLVVE